jgi:uncharacterized NAD(P)/FAD-binding protein YdhS
MHHQPMTERHAFGQDRIAIVGGGLSGAAVLLALLQQQRPADVTVYEPEPEIGPGLAYGAAAPWHLLNVVATRASLMADDPDHLWRWARCHGPALGWPSLFLAGPDDYLPRRLFGHYVSALLRDAQRGNPSLRLRHRRVAVLDIQALAGGFRLSTADGVVEAFDTVILATGAPTATKSSLGGALQHGLWIDDPWDLPRLAAIPADGTVLILGTALTMADTVLSLQQQGHRGRIIAVSRRGIVPPSRCEMLPLDTDFSGTDGRFSLLLRRLRESIAQHGAGAWQGVFEGLRPVTNDLWQTLPAAAQQRFFRHLRSFWDAHRFRMPPSTAVTLETLRAQGHLDIIKGRLDSISADGAGQRVTIRHPSGVTTDYLVAALIDCTGPRQCGENWAARLIGQMLDRGLLRPHASGLGVDATRDGVALNVSGRPVSGLLLIGPPLRGLLLESTAIVDLRKQAEARAALVMAPRRMAV